MEPHNSKPREGERSVNPRMSSTNYGYYYAPNNEAYPQRQQQWSEWSVEQHHYNNANNLPRQNFSEMPPPPPPVAYVPPRGTYYPYTPPPNNSRPFHGQRRYNDTNHQYSPNQQNWNRNSNYKRPRLNSDEHNEPRSKHLKKKKKPLSQNIPSKKDWTYNEAEQALNCEKEYNKRNKNQSLIIKFPDLELNKDIVSKFHSAIENVHFQQPSTARFCFVTLEESADGNSVISALNKIKFGDGYLTAEYKKDREDDQNIGPNDIDPLTLYVGNLAQEITKEDMVKAYPKTRRIDIGYAKRMKYTRYAFVTFKTVADSIEAFKKTHSTQMYSKSLIVRFRRLHGTVGMPGESKAQNQPKNKDGTLAEEGDNAAASECAKNTHVDGEEQIEDEKKGKSGLGVNLNLVKTEPPESSGEEDDDDVDDNICDISSHRPIKFEVKSETPRNSIDDTKPIPIIDLMDVKKREVDDIKEELDDDEDDEPQFNEVTNQSSDDDEDDGNDDGFDTEINFGKMFSSMVAQANSLSSLRNFNP